MGQQSYRGPRETFLGLAKKGRRKQGNTINYSEESAEGQLLKIQERQKTLIHGPATKDERKGAWKEYPQETTYHEKR